LWYNRGIRIKDEFIKELKMVGMNLGVKGKGAVSLGSVKIPEKYFNRFGTGIPSIDNMFGDGGFIKGQIITMSAMRGAGKTTALLQVLNGVVENSNFEKKCLYLSGEEYVEQLAFMAQRINTPNVMADNVTDVDEIAELTKEYDIIVIDSMNALTSKKHKSRMAIESYAMNTITKSAKENDCVIIFILHQTKAGQSAGSTSLEHTCDTCIKIFNVDSEEYGELNCKAFCVDKNRFGQTKDSVFRMTKSGWDFTDPIKEDYDKDKSKSETRANKKEKEIQELLNKISDKSGKFNLKDVYALHDDVKFCERQERHLNSLVKSGKVKKSGRGQSAKFSVKN
jgi:predicted ATP-dependent serine protease